MVAAEANPDGSGELGRYATAPLKNDDGKRSIEQLGNVLANAGPASLFPVILSGRDVASCADLELLAERLWGGTDATILEARLQKADTPWAKLEQLAALRLAADKQVTIDEALLNQLAASADPILSHAAQQSREALGGPLPPFPNWNRWPNAWPYCRATSRPLPLWTFATPQLGPILELRTEDLVSSSTKMDHGACDGRSTDPAMVGDTIVHIEKEPLPP